MTGTLQVLLVLQGQLRTTAGSAQVGASAQIDRSPNGSLHFHQASTDKAIQSASRRWSSHMRIMHALY